MPSTRKQLNIRLSDQGWAWIDQLTDSLGLSQADVVTLGLRLLARRELGADQKKSQKKSRNGVDTV